MTAAERAARIVEWVGDSAPLSDAKPGEWSRFLGLLRTDLLSLIEHAKDEYANRDRRPEIAETNGDDALEARRAT